MRSSTILMMTLALASTLACPRPTTESEPADASKAEPKPELGEPEAELGEPEAEPEPGPATGASEPVRDQTLTADREASTVGFAVARATVGHIGEFEDFEATLELADGQPVALEITVKTGSVIADRSGLTSHLKSADFFHVDNFPTATFTADHFTPTPEEGPDAYVVSGTMHLHGVGRKLEFPATLEIGSTSVVGRATLDISAKAFGIDYEGMEAELAEDAVQLEIELVFPRVALTR